MNTIQQDASSSFLRPVQFHGPSRGLVLPPLYASFVVLQAYDGYATTTGVRNGGVDSNSVMRGLSDRPAVVWALFAF